MGIFFINIPYFLTFTSSAVYSGEHSIMKHSRPSLIILENFERMEKDFDHFPIHAYLR